MYKQHEHDSSIYQDLFVVQHAYCLKKINTCFTCWNTAINGYSIIMLVNFEPSLHGCSRKKKYGDL